MAEINEQKRAEIQEQARAILDNFSKALAKVKLEKKEFKKEVGGFRKEEQGLKSDADFRKRMFENAPNKDKDCIITETKKW
jgi:hypothetical protein